MDRQGFSSLVPLDPGPEAGAPLGLRAKNKAEKLQRIRKAARALFMKRGYDDTTMRDIAKRAGIGFGTLFTYASDKRDLLFLIFNDELDDVVDTAFARATTERVFLDQLVAYFSGFYIFFAPQPELSRVVLREMTLYLKGRQAEQFQASCGRMTGHIASFVSEARAARRLGTREEPQLVGQALLSTFAAEIRRWIAIDDPVLKSGLTRLRRMLALHVTGLAPRPGALGKKAVLSKRSKA
ncbi:MAG TPA: TetR/AcrR family transcriptional regulator [Stellaceae bacterium]|jgi:AcrR family transcriptional regulator